MFQSSLYFYKPFLLMKVLLLFLSQRYCIMNAPTTIEYDVQIVEYNGANTALFSADHIKYIFFVSAKHLI